MSFITRKDERAEIAEILETGEFEDSDQMAAAILTKAVEILSRRKTYGIGVQLYTDRESGFSLPFGPFYTPSAAGKAVKQAQESGYVSWVAPLFPPQQLIPTTDDRNDPCRCGHRKNVHVDRGRCAVFTRGGTGRVATVKPNLPQCGCQGYVKEES